MPIQKLTKPGIAPIKQVEMHTKWYPLMKNHPDALILCPQPSFEVTESVRTNKHAKAADKRQVKRKRADIGTSAAPLPLLEGACTALLPLPEGASIASLTLAVLQDPATSFVPLHTNTISVYDNTAKDTEAIAKINVERF